MKATDTMPRRKKAGQSPARVPGGGGLEGAPSYRPPPTVSNLIPGSSLSTSAKEAIVRNMQEMFSHLDSEVIYIVLSECDFKVEHAMDSLLELSVAATDPQPTSTPESGFERTAAALLSPRHFAKPSSQTETSAQLQCTTTSPTSVLTEDLDFLVDQEVLSLTAEGHIKGHLDSKSLTFTECSQSDLKPQCSGTSLQKSPSFQISQRSGASSPLDKLSIFQDLKRQLFAANDLPTETVDIPSADAFTLGQHSELQQCLKQINSNPGDAVSNQPVPWNIKAPAFYPHIQEKQCPAFITPVASNWPREPRPTLPWHRPISQAQLRPCPAVPPPWTLRPPPPPSPLGHCRLRLEGKVLVLLRGPPGSGKSTLARALLEHNPGGVILSTDDYFIVNGKYHFNPAVLGEAHSWNHNRAKQACEQGANPVIIDNTNMQGWEMRPYVVQALKYNYKVLLREPDTWWKNKPRELERRTKHGVPSERIRRMLMGYERFVSVKSILGSQMPEWKQENEEQLVNCLKPEMLDTVGEPSGKKVQPEAATSQPNVSAPNDLDNCTDELKNADIDMGALDSVLDQIIESDEMKILKSSAVESVFNKDLGLDEIPVAFSGSIGQRVKRERVSRKSGFELANKSESTSKSEEKGVSREEETTAEEGATSSEVKRLEFDGDWPSAPSLDQRKDRRHERRKDTDSCPQKAMSDVLGATSQCTKTEDILNPALAEMHKLLAIIQTGGDSICTDFSPLSSTSPSSEDEQDTRTDQPQGSQSENEEHIAQEETTAECPDSVFNSDAVGLTSVGENEPDLDLGTSEKTASCGQVCESLECELPGETESSRSDDVSGSQDHRQNHQRRSGKQCKLAMTFTQNCLEESADSAEGSGAFQSNDEPSVEPQTGSNPCPEADMEEDPEARPSSVTQTESQDFALLWRVNENGFNACDNSSSRDFRMLSSDPTRFVPCDVVEGNVTNSKEIPYSVAHEKSTQVEERELGPTQDVLENLHILRRHFKQVTLDTLEDLYEKCQQDLEWTTNLLLDSGERFFRDDEEEELCTGIEDEQAAGEGPSSALIQTLQFEELAGSIPDVLVEDIEYSDSTASEPCTNLDTNNCDSTAAPSILDDVSVPQGTYENDNGSLQQIKEKRTPDVGEAGATLLCEEEKCEGAEGAAGFGADTEDDIRSVNEVRRLLQAELEELEKEEKDREEDKARRKNAKQIKKQLFDFNSVELKLPTELALQLTELFGPVGVEPDTGSPEDYVLQIDMNLAKLLHQKWKESVQERQKQADLSFRLLQESSSQWGKPGPGRFQMSSGGTSHLDSHLPLMDHWNVAQPHVFLRDIMKEELVLQANRDKVRQTRADLDKQDGATLIKEDQLFTLFPTIDRHFLQDIFRDHNYSLTQTKLFLHSLLDEGPVKTVVAPDAPRVHPRTPSKDRDKKSVMPDLPSYQDTEDPEYQDFRAEANLQRRRQLESFSKATEAYNQGHKEVASFYAQQGHLHGQRMREANHRAAMQIFQRKNSSLLPQNILDLHGLHVDEALEHLEEVLARKTIDYDRGLCGPQLSVITGRGNHSLGGVARIRPAVLDYLSNKHYRFTEPQRGLVLVSLK